MRIDVVTLFPDMVTHAAGYGVTGRARQQGVWTLACWNPRDFATDSYRTVDDRPYGGGPGMVMLPGPLERAVLAARQAQIETTGAPGRVVYLSPQGRRLAQSDVSRLASGRALTLLAGRYEGVDERLLERVVDEELSIGDYVLSGGEIPALVLMDATVRLLPGVLNDAESAKQESFADGLLDCPHYTRPEVYEAMAVPAVLLSGNHAQIARWRRQQALGRTWERRPDLLEVGALSREDRALLDDYVRSRGQVRDGTTAGKER
jgi:tRNA (guanine37-N1)-methyltransferase